MKEGTFFVIKLEFFFNPGNLLNFVISFDLVQNNGKTGRNNKQVTMCPVINKLSYTI